METEEILAAIQKAAETIATPNWAAILSVIISLFAVAVAGLVAWKQNKISEQQAKIMEQQNKISLFEKRYEIYDLVSQCVSAEPIITRSAKSAKDVCIIWGVLTKESFQTDTANVDIGKLNIISMVNKLEQARFLFHSEEISNYVLYMGNRLLSLIATVDVRGAADETFEHNKEQFHQAIEHIESHAILHKMREELKIN